MRDHHRRDGDAVPREDDAGPREDDAGPRESDAGPGWGHAEAPVSVLGLRRPVRRVVIMV